MTTRPISLAPIIISVLFLIYQSASGAINIYLNSSTGDDCAPLNSISTPWRTLDKALVNIGINGRVIFAAGSYTTGATNGAKAIPDGVWFTGTPTTTITFLGGTFINGNNSRWTDITFSGYCWWQVGDNFIGQNLILLNGTDAIVAKGSAFFYNCDIRPSWDGISLQTGGKAALVQMSSCLIEIPLIPKSTPSRCINSVELNSMLVLQGCTLNNLSTLGSANLVVNANAGITVLEGCLLSISNGNDSSVSSTSQVWLKDTIMTNNIVAPGGKIFDLSEVP